MEWLLGSPQSQNTCSFIGMQDGNAYRAHDTCLETLAELLVKLSTEDRTLRTFRRALGFSQIIQKDLVPLLIHKKDDVKIMDAAVRLLVNLTIPVECLLPMEIMARSDAGRHTVFELNNLLTSAKDAFIEPRSTRSVLDFMRKLVETEDTLTLSQCEGVNNCLLLVRNILHIPETPPFSTAPPMTSCGSKQNLILWNLFAQGIDKLLIHLMTSAQKGFWSITMVQLIALAYKDQHVGTLQKLLSQWFESSLSESSEDNESNTSPPDQRSGDSSPMLTSDPTSDSSDNSSGCNKSATSDANNTKHTQRSHSEHEKNNVRASAEALRKSQAPPSATTSGGRNKGSGGNKNHQHKKERHQPTTSGDHANKHQHHDCRDNGYSNNTSKSKSKHHQNQQPNTSSACQGKKTQSNESSLVTPSSPAASATSQSSSGISSPHSTMSSTSSSLSSSPSGTPHEKRLSMSSEMSDCGYATQAENPETVSTSSNEEDTPHNNTGRNMKPVHQKPHNTNKHNRQHKQVLMTVHNKNDLRRKKLVKRSKSNILNMKALMQHSPTDEDISHLLREFTVDFLLKGYAPLVQDLHSQLISEAGSSVDTSHFFWLISYFLKFAAQLDLDMDIVSPVLSFKIISYLTFEGIQLCEQLQISLLQQEMDLKPCLRRLHLVVTAIREFIQAVETYKKSNHLSREDSDFLNKLQADICCAADLRGLFVLLLRQYNPALQSKQYLQDLVSTNHILLLFLESSPTPEHNNFDIAEHVKQFSTTEMMLQYGRLLESFRENGKFINDCAFTMMHHVSGDLSNVSTLFQPSILKTFSLIWEEDFEVCDDWSDLIEYVIHKFVNTPRRGNPMLPLGQGNVEQILPVEFVQEMPPPPPREINTCRWTKEECDIIYWYFVQSSQSSDPVGHILNQYTENGSTCKTRVGIIEQLYVQDIIGHAQYLDLLKQETVVLQGNSSSSPDTSTPPTFNTGSPPTPKDDISSLIALLLSEKHSAQIQWLQALLLETCYVKLQENREEAKYIMEPLPYHFSKMGQSVPVVPWNLEQCTVLTHPPFVLLLHKLGFHLPADVGKVFPRIPHFWTSDVLYATAQKLGPITGFIKFDVQQLPKPTTTTTSETSTIPVSITEYEDSMMGPSTSTQYDYTSQPNATTMSSINFAAALLPANNTNWMQLVSKSKFGKRDHSPSKRDSDVSKMSISDDDSPVHMASKSDDSSDSTVTGI